MGSGSSKALTGRVPSKRSVARARALCHRQGVAPPKRSAPAPDSAHRPFAALLRDRRASKGAEATPKARARSVAAAPEPGESFATHMARVAPLPAGRARVAPPDAAPTRDLPSSEAGFELADDGERLEGRRLDVDPRELRRLRRGLHVVDATLDLHDKTAAEARAALVAFVRKRHAAGDRLLLVIHGRGRRSANGQAVLRGEVGAWLAQGSAARHVWAFATAPAEQGGSGALLVLLAKDR